MSRALSSLESRLGVHLVTRTSRSFELTEEGSLFYERCQRIATDIAEAEAEASSKTGTVKGRLRLGAPNEIGQRARRRDADGAALEIGDRSDIAAREE